MSISYSNIIGYGKQVLPSVESWGTNNNILKDPPKSITTRRRDKVGSNSMIVQDVEMSRDRIAETIKAYPRGVNPMVGVSYNNARGGQQAKLPYRVAMAGAFRPPVLAPVDLLPLSRMPRNVTKVEPTICKPDFRKKLTCEAAPNTYKQNIVNQSCAAKTSFIIKKPTVVFDPKHIQNVLNVPVSVNRAMKMERDRNITGVMDISLKTPNVAYDVSSNKKMRANDRAKQTDIKKFIVNPLQKEASAPKSSFLKQGAVPQIFNQTRESVIKPSIVNLKNIKKEISFMRPEYKRMKGMGNVLVPDNGVYNVRK
jgi:hypothetical protein